jgi:hypothetical protein
VNPIYIPDYPLLVFVLTLVGLGASTLFGFWLRKRFRSLRADESTEFDIVEGATLTLLGLIVGFSFSMAVNHYDRRKDLEEVEANAIGTQYLRAELAGEPTGSRMRETLKAYLDQRIRYYSALDSASAEKSGVEAAPLQAELWSLARTVGVAQPTPIAALVVSGMNDVLNAYSDFQAAWRNRIPADAWLMMGLIALGANGLLGYGARRFNAPLFFVVPLTVAMSFMLIADIDSPRGGRIRVLPQNLIGLAQSLAAR